MKAVLALDQGTTSSRAILFDHDGAILGSAQRPLRQIYPQPGRVEHDAREIWESQLAVAQQALRTSGLAPHEIAAVGLANQRETTVVWERHSGAPLGNAIVWQCRRTARMCAKLAAAGHAATIRAKTGLLPDPYFSASKLAWILDHQRGARARAARGELLFGTVDSWLAWNLSGRRLHITDASNAARTMLFNIHTRRWDEELLHLFDIPAAMLPRVCDSSEHLGVCEAALLGAPLPLAGIAGDQQAALFGQGCHAAGTAKNTYGTGCFLLLNTGTQPHISQAGLLTTIAWSIGRTTTYALEGSGFSAGSAIQWLRDELGLLDNAAASEQLARQIPDNGGVYLAPRRRTSNGTGVKQLPDLTCGADHDIKLTGNCHPEH